MKSIRFVTLALAALLAWSSPTPLHAQDNDDWEVEGGNERQRKIIKRYKTLLERNPTEGLAFRKLIDYVGKGKGLERLVGEYRRKVENNPDRANYRLILGHLLKAKNEYDKALEQYEKAVELEPKNPVAWLSRGAVHVLLQHNDKATADFEKALELEKDRSKKQDILRKLADAAFAQRDWERAQKYYDQLVALDPRNEYLRMEYAQVLVQYKRYEKAMEQYQELLDLAGRDAKAKATTLRDIGDLYEKMGQDDKAVEIYEKAMRLMRRGNWLHRELRQRIVAVYRRTDRLGELVEQYEKKWGRPNFDQAMLLGGLYDELGQEDDALRMFEIAVRRNRRATEPRQRIIRIKERRGDDKGVIKGYRDLIRVAPGEARYYFDLVRLHFRLGDRKAAERLLSRIERRFRRDPDVHVMLADTYMRFDMNEKALRVYKKLVRMDPRNDAYILGLGEYYYQNGELDDAVKTWTKLLDSSLEEAEAEAKLGQVLAEHGMVEKGLEHFERAVEAAPEDSNVRRGLALAYERARRWQNAIDTWTWLLERSDQPLTANEARTRIINIYQRQNKLRGKLREYAADFSKNPDDVDSGLFLAEAYTKLVMYDKAEEVLKKIASGARNHDPESSVDPNGAAKMTWKQAEITALLSLERLYRQNNNLEAAIDTLQRLAELLPHRSRDYYHQIADLSLKLYEDDQAVHYATLAVQMNPDDAMAQARLGDVYHKMGKLEAAAAQYRQAIDLDPRAFEITMKLAEILLELGRHPEAEELYRRVTKKANDENLILKAARRAQALAEVGGRLEELESDFFKLVYRTPPKPVYRKVMLELYDRMTNPHVARDRYAVQSVRREAAVELDEIGQRALPVLIDALNAEEVGQRILAVQLLGDLRQPNAALPLSRMVDDPKDPLRMPAAIAVAQIGDPRASAPLIRVTQDSNPAMRELAAWALGAIGGPSAAQRLATILDEGQSWREQVMAAISLGRIGSEAAVDALMETYVRLTEARYADSTVVAVVWALGRAGDERAVATLTRALHESSDRVATVSAWSLAQIGGQDATRGLLEAYWSAKPAVRARAGRGLVQLAAQRDTKLARRRVDEIRREIRFIDDRNPNVAVESMLAELERTASVVVPTDATDFIDDNAKLLADVAAKRLGDHRARDVVTSDFLDIDGTLGLGVLTSTIPATKERAEQRDEAVRQVVQMLQDSLREVAKREDQAGYRAIGLLGALADPADLERIEARLDASSTMGRRYALMALAGYPAREVQNHLFEALDDEDYAVRAVAAASLGQVIGSRGDVGRAVRELGEALGDRFGSVQIAAATALGKIGDPEAAGALIGRLSGSQISVKVAILKALQQIESSEAKTALRRYQTHSDLRLRRAAGGR
jgi:tetratricopeptide (TPR) repeat protein